MHRFHLPPAACRGPRVELPETEVHHAVHVLRLGRGEAAAVHDGAGTVLLCRVAETSRRAVQLEVLERQLHPRRGPFLTLFQAVAKTRAMEFIIQKATELGAARVVPVLAERSVPRLAPAEAAARAARWREIAIEAMKQCGAPWLPELLPPVPLREVLARLEPFDLALVAALTPQAVPARVALEPLRHARQAAEAFRLAVWVGPEGDFTPAELEAITRSGARPVSLGPRVLRCETAALWCLAVVSYEASGGTVPGEAPAVAAAAADSKASPRAMASNQSQATGSTRLQ